MKYNIANWYWKVDGSTTQVYSSASASFVLVTDATYLAWTDAGQIATRIGGDDMLKIRIEILEASATPRRIRESVAGTDGGWMVGLNTEIAALRAQLT